VGTKQGNRSGGVDHARRLRIAKRVLLFLSLLLPSLLAAKLLSSSIGTTTLANGGVAADVQAKTEGTEGKLLPKTLHPDAAMAQAPGTVQNVRRTDRR
jgi:hypothetical protein